MYQHGKKTKAPRNLTVFLAVLAFMGLIVLLIWWMIHKDIGNSSEPRTTVPIVTEISADTEEKVKINETYFTMELPADWKLLQHNTGTNVNAYVYAATKKGADDRKLYVHVDVMPQTYKLNRLQPITPNGDKFTLGNVSEDCINFAGEVDRRGNEPFQAKWENISFVCDPITSNQTIGTGTVGAGIRSQLGKHSYFFFYEDHNIRPDAKILRDALQSFRAR